MNRKIVSGMMVMLFLVSILSNFAAAITEASSTTTFYVDPASIVNPALTPGSTFSVDVKVSEASYLYSWQVFMSWDKGVLEYSSHVFGGFLDDQPDGSFTGQKIEEEWLLIAETTLGKHLGKTAPEGVLATITFFVLDIGETILNIDYNVTCYFECVAPPEHPFERYPVRENGYFNNCMHATIDELKTEVEDLGSEGEIDNQGIVKSLVAKLNVVQKLVEKGKTEEAIGILQEDFIPQVQNLSDIQMTPQAAEILIESTEYIISHL